MTDDDKQWRIEGQKLAPSNRRFISRPSTHTSQILTAATIATSLAKPHSITVAKSHENTTETKTRTTKLIPSGDSVDKKAPSLRVQNVLKYIISQNPNGTLAKSQQLVNNPPSRSVHSAPVTPVKRSTQPLDTKLNSALTMNPQLTKVLSPLKALVMSATAEGNNTQATSVRVVSGNEEGVNKESGTEKDEKPGVHAGLECDESLDASPVKNKTSSEPSDSHLPVKVQTDISTEKTSKALSSNENEAPPSALPVSLELTKENVSDSVSNSLEDSESLLIKDNPSDIAEQDAIVDTKGSPLDECHRTSIVDDEPSPCPMYADSSSNIHDETTDQNTDKVKIQEMDGVEQNESKVIDTPGAEMKQGTDSSMSIVETGSILSPTMHHTPSGPAPTHPIEPPTSSLQPHTPEDQSTSDKSPKTELRPSKPLEELLSNTTNITKTDNLLEEPIPSMKTVNTTTSVLNTDTVPVTETQTETVLPVSDTRKRPASIDSLVDVTPAKKQALSTTLKAFSDPLPLTEQMDTPLSLTGESDVPHSQTEDEAVTSTDTSEKKAESTLKSITEALVSPTVIPDTGSLLQSLCTADPYSLEESELATELGLDSVDPSLLNLSGFMDIIQLPGTPTTPMNVDVAPLLPGTPTTPMNVDVAPLLPGTPTTPMNVDVAPLLPGTPTTPKNVDVAPLPSQTINTVSHSNVDMVVSSSLRVLSSPVAPTVTTPFPSVVPPQLQLLPVSTPRSQGTMLPIVAHQHFSPTLSAVGSPILSSRPSLLQQPGLPVTLFYQTTAPGNTIVSPQSTFPQLQSGVSLVSSSGQQPILAAAVAPEVIIALPLGANAPSLISPFLASGEEDGGVGTRLSSKQTTSTSVVQTRPSQSISDPQLLPTTPLAFGPPEEKREGVSSDMVQPVQQSTVDLLPQQVTLNPTNSTADPTTFPLPITRPGLDIMSRVLEQGQPINPGATPLASKDPEVVQLTPRDVDLLQRLSLGGTDIGDIMGDVNEKELLEGIPLDLAATIQAIARIDEQDSVPWKQ